MKVLVAYATRHGATRGIAERIADRLGQRGLEVTLLPVDQVGDIASYDAFVIGAAAYMYHWLKDATDFVRRHRSLLATRPVWLFSSGPTGTDTVDKNGHDIRAGAEPSEFQEFRDVIHPRGERVFFGAYDPDAEPIGFAERVAKRMPESWRAAIPSGDFRDWQDIESWTTTITAQLAAVPDHVEGAVAGAR